MARIRSVHPSLWTDENFVSLTMASRLFLVGLWGEADDYGIFEWKPVGLKMRIMPADAVDAGELLNECEASGFLVRIERAGKPYGLVRNFRKFQRPKNPSEPSITVDLEIANVVKLPSSDKNYPALPQTYPSPTENPPQMEDVGCRMEEKEEDIPSPSEPGADAPPTYTDARHELWGEGKPILLSLGVPERQCGQLIGRWLKTTGDDAAGVLDAIQRAREARPHDPIPWITRALPTKANRHERPDNSRPDRRPSGTDQAITALANAVARRTGGWVPPDDPGGGGIDDGPAPMGGASGGAAGLPSRAGFGR